MQKGFHVLITDVDGVLTDGCVYVDSSGNESIRFSRLDGKGLQLLKKKGFILCAISGEDVSAVRLRLQKLGFNEIRLGVTDKCAEYDRIKEKYNVFDQHIIVCGDDVQDIGILKRAGLACCPENAQPGVRDVCQYRSERTGGEHFIREICNIFSGGK